MSDAETEWSYINNNLWVQDTTFPGDSGWHYSYQGSALQWECEAGGFLQIISWLMHDDVNVANSTRLFTDVENRFLQSNWDSPQWIFGFQGHPDYHWYACNHEININNQSRLANTIISWAAILGMFDYLGSYQTNVTAMLLGSASYDPAWKLLMNTNSKLYDSTLMQFRSTSDGIESNLYTSYGAALLLILGIVPINATLAIPIEELHYEYVYNMLDHDLFNVNLTARNVTLSIGRTGTVAFQFNSTIYHDFSQGGVYRVEFNSDWSSIISVTRVGDLPSNREYLFQVAPPVPEFPSFLVLPLIIATLLAVIVYRKKLAKISGAPKRFSS